MEKRHDINFLSICGEKLLADPAGSDDFKNKLRELIDKESLYPEKVYNIHKTGPNFKCLPE